MRIRKSDKSDQPDEQKVLEERVDAIMNKGQDASKSEPQAEAPAETGQEPTAAPPAEKPVAEQKTAPDLPDKLLKTLKVDKSGKAKKATAKAAAPPIVIELADEAPADTGTSKPAIKTSEAPAEDKADAEEPEPDKAAVPELAELDSVNLDDTDTDQAVEEIIAKEGNTQLAVEDALAARHRAAASAKPKGAFAEVFLNKWTWITIIAIVALAAGFFLLLSGF